MNCALVGKARGAQVCGAPTVSRASKMKPERAPVSSGQEAGVPEPARPRAGVALSNPQSVHLISGRNEPCGEAGPRLRPSSWPSPGATLRRPRLKRIRLPPRSEAMEAERPRRARGPRRRAAHAPDPWASCGSDCRTRAPLPAGTKQDTACGPQGLDLGSWGPRGEEPRASVGFGSLDAGSAASIFPQSQTLQPNHSS